MNDGGKKYRLLGFVFFIWVLISSFCGTGYAKTLCHIADPHDPTLNVRDSPGGTVINRLVNGRMVRVDEVKADNRDRHWALVSGSFNGEWRQWGWVFRSSLRCVDTNSFPREEISVKALRSVGLLPQGAFSYKQFPIACDIVPNGWGVSISNELYSYYKGRGFTEKAVCLGLGTDGVNFDPATGKRLPIYKLSGDVFDLLYPLYLPDCFRTVEIVDNKTPGYLLRWRPTNCQIHYHPTTGVKVSDPRLVELEAGGEAGPGTDEDNQSSTVSEDRLKEILYGK